MGDRQAEIQQALEATHNETRSVLESIPEERYGVKTSNGWTVGELAGHIASAGNGHMFVIGRVRKGSDARVPKPLMFIVDLMNFRNKRKFSKTSREELLRTLDEQQAKVSAAVQGLTDAELDQSAEILSMGKMTLYEYLMRNGEHPREHAAELRKALA